MAGQGGEELGGVGWGAQGRRGKVYLQTRGVRKVARETGAVIPNQIAPK